MEISVTEQTLVFLAACAFGAVLGAFYDVFRVFRVAVPCPRVVIFLQDVLYWAVCAVATFLFILCVNGGVVRAFVIGGELIGAVLYYFTIGWLVLRSAKAIIAALRAFFRFVARLIARPFRGLFRLCTPPARKMGSFSKKFCQNGLKSIHTHLQSGKTMVYNLESRTKKQRARSRRKSARRRKSHGQTS